MRMTRNPFDGRNRLKWFHKPLQLQHFPNWLKVKQHLVRMTLVHIRPKITINFMTPPSGQYFSLFLCWSLYHSDVTEEQKEKDSIHDWKTNEFEKLRQLHPSPMYFPLYLRFWSKSKINKLITAKFRSLCLNIFNYLVIKD